MKTLVSAVCAAMLGSATPAFAQSTDIETQATEIVLNSAKFLASQPAFSFSWFVTFDEVTDDQKISYIRSGNTLMVRDSGFYSQTEREDTLRDYYWDGSEFTIFSPNEDFYVSSEFTGSFDELVEAVREKTGTVLPMWSILSESFPDDLLSNVEAAAYLGTTLIAGQEAHHVVFREPEEDWQVWISTDEDAPWPLMLFGTHRNDPEDPQYRVYMSDWNADPDTDPSQFKFEPDEGALQLYFPQLSAMTKSSSDQ